MIPFGPKQILHVSAAMGVVIVAVLSVVVMVIAVIAEYGGCV